MGLLSSLQNLWNDDAFSSKSRTPGDRGYAGVVQKTERMVSDRSAQKLAQRHGLQILNVTWEDTGRYQGSCVGPNISDMTIQVQQKSKRTGQYELTCMPVIRHPNFSDRSGDVPLESFNLLVGNERGDELKRVSLKKYLGNIREYLNKPESWKGDGTSLLADRDTHLLTSAQACFLPVPEQETAEFNPVLFNYQSTEGDPAVLTILASREGTSATIIDNTRDAFDAGQTWGQRLFFNQEGERASLTGQRLSDSRAEQEAGGTGDHLPAAGSDAEAGLNMVLLIQVPLEQKPRPRTVFGGPPTGAMPLCCCAPCCDDLESTVEEAVIGHGEVEGPFTEIDGLEIKRDKRFPIRVTVQFYKATSNGVVSADDMSQLASQIQRVYDDAEYVGSLVVDGATERPTEYDGRKTEPPGWWDAFWAQHEANTSMTREQTIALLERLFGASWATVPRSAVEEAVRRRSYCPIGK